MARTGDKTSQSPRQTTTVNSKSSKATSSKISKTSNQRQRDLIIAQQRREEIERQNEATLRLAKQKQQLELEQQELELQKLRKDKALRVEEQGENRRKLAEAPLFEMELRDDMSDSNADFHESLSRLEDSSEGKETARIKDWINNSPSGAEIEMQPSIVAQATITSTDNLGVQPTPQSFPVNVIASAPVVVLPLGKSTGSESHDDETKSDYPKPSFDATAITSCTL